MHTLIEEDLPMQIDFVQWHPKKMDVLAVGAYQLDPTNNDVRLGRLYIIKLTPQIPGGFTVVTEHETKGGVLDMKFYSTEDFDFIAVAASEGLFIFNLVDTELKEIHAITTTYMCLFLQWISSEKLIFSDAEGCVNIVEKGEISKRKKLHDALTWVVHYSEEQDIVYAGCDEGKLTAFELDQIMREEFHLNMKYTVGVTNIIAKEEIVFVGGYDDVIKIYELVARRPKPFLVQKLHLNLGGAIWRIAFLPSLFGTEDHWRIGIACGKKGVKILEFDRPNNKLKVLWEYLKYDGYLCYGLDVKVDYLRCEYLLANAYFDNHVLHVFRLNL